MANPPMASAEPFKTSRRVNPLEFAFLLIATFLSPSSFCHWFVFDVSCQSLKTHQFPFPYRERFAFVRRISLVNKGFLYHD